MESTTEKKVVEEILHSGGCHCGKVTWTALAPSTVTVVKCNCSICIAKQYSAVIIPKNKFNLVTGHDDVQIYSFNTGKAKHPFCTTCGVTSYYFPRSNPDGIGFMTYSVKSSSIKEIICKAFDGQNWEASFAEAKYFHEFSKE